MRQFPLSLSFPSGVPSDARRLPFSYTACVSQASGSSELIPCIRLQTREIVSRVRNPQRWARCFLSTFRWLRCHEKLAPEYPERYRRSLIIQANRLLVAATMSRQAVESSSADAINKLARLNKNSGSLLVQPLRRAERARMPLSRRCNAH